MRGAIIGDVVGSVYEFDNISVKDFPLFSRGSCFTDDTVMTCAVAKVLIDSKGDFDSIRSEDVVETMHEIARMYPYAGYGGRFYRWVFSDNPQPYNSFGNGSAMRVSPVGFAARSEDEVKRLSRLVTEITHNHPEGLKGAECTAMCIYLARHGMPKEELRRYVEENYYKLDKSCDELRREIAGCHGAETCQVTMPQALACFFESTDFEDCIRNCISIGADSDTIAAIAGAIAEAYYGLENNAATWAQTMLRLDGFLLSVVRDFDRLLASTPSMC